jgi:hypothetical protein
MKEIKWLNKSMQLVLLPLPGKSKNAACYEQQQL